MLSQTRFLALVASFLCSLALSAGALGQPSPATDDMRTVQEGVFSEDQANRGQEHYEANCMRCHGADLTGGGARPLVGDEFLRNWLGLSLDGLFDQLNTMPPSAAGTLGEGAYLEILSFILERNAFPLGDEELNTSVLSDIRIEGQDGPQAVPNNTLVQVVGCLTRTPDEAWLVTDASEPVRTRNPSASAGDERNAISTVAPGPGSFELLYVFPSPDAFEGQQVEAKGFLIRGDQDAINVTSIDGLGTRCVP